MENPKSAPTNSSQTLSETATLVGRISAFYALALLIICTYIVTLISLLDPDHPHVMVAVWLGVACFAFAILCVTGLAFVRLWLFSNQKKLNPPAEENPSPSSPIPHLPGEQTVKEKQSGETPIVAQ